MLVVCPGCGSRFTPPDALQLGAELVDVQPIELQPDGTAFRALRPGEERHIDQRLRCKACRFHQR